MKHRYRWRSENAQDLVEYALLLAFIVLAVAAAVAQVGNGITIIWTLMNGRYTAAGS